jgi:hypothetical protein
LKPEEERGRNQKKAKERKEFEEEVKKAAEAHGDGEKKSLQPDAETIIPVL